MATQTTGNLKLSKPDGTDKVKEFRAPYNSNLDKIDEAVSAQSQQIVNLGNAIAYVENGDTASLTYTAEDFILWKGIIYTVNSGGIPAGTAIAGHVTTIENGGFNNILGLLNKIKHGVIRGSDIGDIPASATNFEITIPNEYFIAGSLVYYGPGNIANWIVRSMGAGRTIIRIANNTNSIIEAASWRFNWFAIEP